MKKLIILIFIFFPLVSISQGLINNGGYITVLSGAYINISGNNSNYINQSNSGFNGRVNLAGTIELQGNWFNYANTGNYIFTDTPKNDGSVIFQSINPQIIGGTETTDFENLIVNNNNGINLDLNENINGNLTLIQGIINTSSNILNLSESSHIFGGNNLSFVIGTISKKYSGISDNPFTFPLGSLSGSGTNNSGYSPFTIKFDNTPSSGNLSATVSPMKNIHADQSLSLNRFWTLSSSLNFTGNYNASFTYLANDFIEPFTEITYESDMYWGQWINEWIYPAISLRISSGAGGSIEVKGINSFGEFTGLLCPKPVINNTLSDQTECEGKNINFYVDATDAKSYQWSKNGENIPGATTSNLKLEHLNLNDAGIYLCIISNTCGDIVFKPFILEVAQKPVINITPVTQQINAGDSISYTLSPGGNSPFTYQWYKTINGQQLSIEGATLNFYHIKSINCTDAGKYSCFVTNICGSNTVEAGTIIVNNCNKFSIDGYVLYDKTGRLPVKGTTVYLKSPEEVKLDSSFTDINGAYKFVNVENGSYLLSTLNSQLSTLLWGGSNPIDALLVNRYYLGTYNFISPLREKAANVNNDKTINPIDALLINRRYIGTINKFTIDDWLFEKIGIIVNGSDIIQDIRAICAGDVDASYPKKYKKHLK